MDAKTLFELVKDWPREAWPENITWYDHESFGYAGSGVRFDGIRRGLPLMFEVSGMRWLEERITLKLVPQTAGGFYIFQDDGKPISAKTRIGVISDAIRSISPEGAAKA